MIGSDRCNHPISTVFIGGGTPSVLNPQQMSRIMTIVKDNFTLEEDTEITIECNPGTLDEEKLSAYRDCGINRISLGLQSTEDDELKSLGRIHTYEEFLKSYGYVVKAGFTNINVDLMSGIPGQTLESLERSLKRVCELDPAPVHISAYSLIVEEETPFGEMAKDGKLTVPDEDMDREMYHMTSRLLSKYGYDRYEISNYSKPGYECLHNLGYWTGAEYYGAGLDASSYVNHSRLVNTSDFYAYIKNPVDGPYLIESLSENDLMSEYMILRLRLIKGVSKNEFKNRFSKDLSEVYGKEIERFKNLELLQESGDSIFLTKRGLDLANQVMQAFI